MSYRHFASRESWKVVKYLTRVDRETWESLILIPFSGRNDNVIIKFANMNILIEFFPAFEVLRREMFIASNALKLSTSLTPRLMPSSWKQIFEVCSYFLNVKCFSNTAALSLRAQDSWQFTIRNIIMLLSHTVASVEAFYSRFESLEVLEKSSSFKAISLFIILWNFHPENCKDSLFPSWVIFPI